MLDGACIIWRTFLYQFKRQFISHKTLAIAIVMGIWLNAMLRPVADFCYQTGYRVFPWFFPFLSSDYICQMFIVTGGVFLLSDAQISEQNRLYMQYRTGTFCWKCAGIVYIAVVAMIYVLGICGMGWLNLADVMTVGRSWGKIWGTLVQTSAAVEYHIPFSLFYGVMTFPPMKASLYAVLLEWLCISFLGVLMYILNDITGKKIGGIAAAGCIFLDLWLYNANVLWLSRYSPVTMAQLRYYNGDYARYGLTLSYAFGYLGLLCMGITLCILISTGRWRRKRKRGS